MNEGLKVTHLSVGYGKRLVISGLSLPVIAPGSMVAVLGPNAVGKSTMLQALAGLHKATGNILLDGVDLQTQSPAQRVRLVGYLPQTLPQPTSLVAYEAMLSAVRAVRPDLPARRAEALVSETFDELDLSSLALRRLAEMSGGQRQMVGLAQVIVRKPRLLLLDEPTSALDLRWQLGVIKTVRTITARDKAICLMAVHDINLAMRFCDVVIVLGKAGLLAAGPPSEVMTADILREAYGVEGRVERCSRELPVVLIDRAVETR